MAVGEEKTGEETCIFLPGSITEEQVKHKVFML